MISSGRGQHASEHGVLPVEAGSVVFIPPGVGHEYRGCEDLMVYNCLFRADLDEAELMWAFRDGHLSALFNPDGLSKHQSLRRPVTVQLDDAGLRTVIGALEPIRLGEADVRTRTGQFAHLLLALDAVATAHHVSSGRSTRLGSPVVAAALDLMERDITVPWTLEELSRELFVGRFHLARMFATCVGLPPMHYLSRIRAERAAAMLAGTDDSVASIGAAVGWPDPPHFSRRFRSVMGVSPREYRRRLRAGANSEARRRTNPAAIA